MNWHRIREHERQFCTAVLLWCSVRTYFHSVQICMYLIHASLSEITFPYVKRFQKIFRFRKKKRLKRFIDLVSINFRVREWDRTTICVYRKLFWISLQLREKNDYRFWSAMKIFFSPICIHFGIGKQPQNQSIQLNLLESKFEVFLLFFLLMIGYFGPLVYFGFFGWKFHFKIVNLFRLTCNWNPLQFDSILFWLHSDFGFVWTDLNEPHI